MREWLPASEIAALELPGLPKTERGVIKLAARDGWHASITPEQIDALIADRQSLLNVENRGIF